MLSSEAQSRLAVVLVGARNPQNIGAAARAMQDFGFRDLRIVNSFAAPFEAAQLEAKSAVGAAEVMREARRFQALPEAIADCGLVVGTTAIGGRELRLPVLPLREAAPRIRSSLASSPTPTMPAEALGSTPTEEAVAPQCPQRVALLFGSEKTGLTNEQLSHCSLLLTVPMFAPAGRHLSMNLGQAVAVCLYELCREGFEEARTLPVLHKAPVTAADRERLTALLRETMERSGYARRFPANARLEVVRQLAGHLGDSGEEAATWMGLFRLLLRALPAAERHVAPEPSPNSVTR